MKKTVMTVGSLFLLGYMVIVAFASLLIGAVGDGASPCDVSPQTASVPTDASNASIDVFVKQYEEAYLKVSLLILLDKDINRSVASIRRY
ncbi:hypothetical protein [Streptococcus equi]|uniref:hypothetical protein n=1 Tax=Streptococcus equi TaxID=1336 RepID=UPI001E3C588B|nr:hypothetical protein [Streptococcus equi]